MAINAVSAVFNCLIKKEQNGLKENIPIRNVFKSKMRMYVPVCTCAMSVYLRRHCSTVKKQSFSPEVGIKTPSH